MKSPENTSPKPVQRRMTARLDGRVQGVGFRFTTVEVARNYAVRGYVQNVVDGSVRVVAEGEEAELLRFLAALRASHVYRFVGHEALDWGPYGGEFSDFSIRYA